MNGSLRATAGVVWRTSPIPGPDDAAWLAPSDLDDAAAIAHPAARTRFLAARALLRRTVRETCPGADIEGFAIEASPSGRPTARLDGPGPYLSVSHTRGLAAAAVSTAVPVGIDAEPLDRHELPTAEAWLTPGERRRLDEVPSEQRRVRLLYLWVAKEAAIKACDVTGHRTRRELSIGGGGRVIQLAAGTDDPGGTEVAAVGWSEVDGRFLVAVAVGSGHAVDPGAR